MNENKLKLKLQSCDCVLLEMFLFDNSIMLNILMAKLLAFV
jgi:hypothetical protein